VYNFLQAGSKTDLMFSDTPKDVTGDRLLYVDGVLERNTEI